METKEMLAGPIAWVIFTLCLGSADAAIFDAGQALKDDMLSTKTNPYTDAYGGKWTFGKTTAVTGGTVTTLGNPGSVWADSLAGFVDNGDGFPAIHVNTSNGAVPGGGFTSDGYTIDPGEIALHPDNDSAPYAILRFIVPQTGVYDVAATFRDTSAGASGGSGVDVHVVINGTEVSNAVVSSDPTPPDGAVTSFTADLPALSLNADDTVDFVVGPNGFYGYDGTGVRATITSQTPHLFDIINLDINGYAPGEDAAPVTADTYSGAAQVGAAGDFWNSAIVADATVAGITIPSLRLADGITNTTVRFTLSTNGGGQLRADRVGTNDSTTNSLLDDYVYLNHPATSVFTLAGLAPNTKYVLYFYCHAGLYPIKGRFVIGGVTYESHAEWLPSGGSGPGYYAECAGITADSHGLITGVFSGIEGATGVFNGLQVIGTFPCPHTDIVNIDINGYNPVDGDAVPTTGDTFSGAARIGWAGDFWNGMTVENISVESIALRHLKPSEGLRNSTVCFSLSTLNGDKLGGDRIDPAASLNNLLFDDYVYSSGVGKQFTLTGLLPSTPYDLYFYCHAGIHFLPGRFVIDSVTYDSIYEWFPAGGSGAGNYALCAGITSDSNGSITGSFNGIGDATGVLNGVQISGPIPRLRTGTIILIQ